MSVYKEYKVYGPYDRDDGRKHVVLVHKEKGSKKTVSYPKYLVETRRGEKLESNETVDHIDGNPKNNDPDNLQVLTRREHLKLDVKRLKKISYSCPMCDKDCEAVGNKAQDIIKNRKQGNAGPFCSKECAGRYGAFVQNNKMEEVEPTDIDVEYTTWKESGKDL